MTTPSMLVLGSQTAQSLGPLTRGRDGVIFVQANMGVGPSPIKIEWTSDPARRLREIDRDCPVETFWIGWIQHDNAATMVKALAEQYKPALIRNDWYAPTAELTAYIAHVALPPLRELVTQLRPHSHPEGTVDIDEMAQLLGVSVSTVRRMVSRGELPVLRVGRQLRFVPADVIATLQQHGGG